jgi:hypothetical protein
VKFNIKEFVLGYIKKSVTRLFLSFIYVLEDIVADGRMSDEEFQKIRKRILDHGNNTIRDITKELENFDFLFINDDNNRK